MVLNYDFDMFSVMPEPSDPEISALMKQIGADSDSNDNKIALFRDPRTAAALRAAPKVLQDYLVASGFGLNHYHSGAPAGFYRESDEDARLSVMERMAENLSKFALPKAGETPKGGFNLADLTGQMMEAQPIPDVAPGKTPSTMSTSVDRVVSRPPAASPLAPKTAENAGEKPRRFDAPGGGGLFGTSQAAPRGMTMPPMPFPDPIEAAPADTAAAATTKAETDIDEGAEVEGRGRGRGSGVLPLLVLLFGVGLLGYVAFSVLF